MKPVISRQTFDEIKALDNTVKKEDFVIVTPMPKKTQKIMTQVYGLSKYFRGKKR